MLLTGALMPSENLSPTVEKNSQNSFVMESGSYFIRFFIFRLSIILCLVLVFLVKSFISLHNFLLSRLYSLHLSCRYLFLLNLITFFKLFL